MNFHQPPVTFVGRVDLKVQDLERSVAFYQDVIGFKLFEKTQKSAKFTVDGNNVLLSIEQPEDVMPKQRRTTGLYHFAILLPHRADLANILKHFVQLRLPLQGASDHLVSEALYLADPDGNGIEIYIDRPASDWTWNESQVVMTTEPLDAEGLLEEDKRGTWNGLPAGTVMGHIHLHVSELDKTEEFYTKGLGFNVVSRYGPQALFISTGKYHHHIGLNTWNGVGAPKPAENSVGLRSFSLVLPDEESVKETISRLISVGAEVTEENGVIVTVDPSGNRIKLETA
ncbi:VOC family protein [Mesobacillus sp. AQ2]|uniref:VOC family protein n=1 Tax=unclassified Mesobacillus TaxID=2675270 RepID=UPI00203FE1A6|nr:MULTISPECIES: VOC family protein [unclassified Mesobacillus]MCM3125081.1 VOC family protein [Mesobacillus sp. MER 33]MCM3235159.1 VOC family protein [Mesobacillus sp. MER 48]WHX39910.1 VOC family protein [Mesobacillus sp. AQ2]